MRLWVCVFFFRAFAFHQITDRMKYSHKRHNLWVDDVRFSSMVCPVYCTHTAVSYSKQCDQDSFITNSFFCSHVNTCGAHCSSSFSSSFSSLYIQFCIKFMTCIRNSAHTLWLVRVAISNIVWRSKLSKNISHQSENDKWIVGNMCVFFLCRFAISLIPVF